MLVEMADDYYMGFSQDMPLKGVMPKHEDLRAMEYMTLDPRPVHGSHSLPTRAKKTKRPIEQHQYYFAMVFDPDTGKTTVSSSSSLMNAQKEIMQDASSRMSKHCRKLISNINQTSRRGTDHLSQDEDEVRSSKRRRNAEDAADMTDDSSSQREMHSTSEEEDPDDNMVQLRADATADWEKWFTDAFRAIQQVSCRVIAKEWIKTIHPKKQSTHPYNGKNPRTGEKGDPNDTKPPYWPKNVQHKEPDHIMKDERMQLLVHLLMSTPHQEMSTIGELRSTREITAEVLKESLDQKKRDHPEDPLRKKYAIIEDIISVRTNLEQFEAGGMPSNTVFTARNYSDFGRGNKHDLDDDDDMPEGVEDSDNNAAEEKWVQPSLTKSPSGLNVHGKGVMLPGPKPNAARSYSRRPSGSKNTQHRAFASNNVSQYGLEAVPPGYHPPMAWPPEGYHSDPAMETNMQIFHGQPTHEAYTPHVGYAANNWSEQMHPAMSMSGQYDNNMMVSPTSMSAVSPHGHFSDGVTPNASHVRYGPPSQPHPAQYNPVSIGQPTQMIRVSGTYDPYMNASMTPANEGMQRAYFA